VVKLEGPSGNAEAIGSTVKVHFKEEGRVQSHEVSAGGGYLSQSANSIRIPSKQFELIEKISVRWPDGVTDEKRLNSDSSDIVFRYQNQSGGQ
jgi:hypothetical protein